MATISISELLIGAYRADSNERSRRRMAYIERIVAEVPSLPFDLSAARTHARLRASLMQAGRPIGSHDLIIAATAVDLAFGLVTRNEVEFRRIPELIVHPLW